MFALLVCMTLGAGDGATLSWNLIDGPTEWMLLAESRTYEPIQMMEIVKSKPITSACVDGVCSQPTGADVVIRRRPVYRFRSSRTRKSSLFGGRR